jgi:hypothetical protein
MVVPLRIGGGSRLKILEAAAAGLPVISTRVGAEGLELVPGEHYTQADEPDRMADSLVACLRDPGPARAMAGRGRDFVLRRYDWDALASRLERVWLDCLGHPPGTLVEVAPDGGTSDDADPAVGAGRFIPAEAPGGPPSSTSGGRS